MAFNNVVNKIKKFSFFRYGVRQTMVTFIAFIFCLAFTAFIVDRAEKIRFIGVAKDELKEKTISREVFKAINEIITESCVLDNVWPIVAVIGSLFLSWIIMRRAAGLNWSRPVALSSAVEFSSAMRKIGRFDFSDQMACVHKHNLHVYIANAPLLEDQGENVYAKLYSYAHNDILVLEDLLTKSIGKRLLCLDAADYDPVCQQYSQTAHAVTLAKIAELEGHIKTLKGEIILTKDENTKLTEEKSALQDKNSTIARKLEMALRRNDKDDKYYLHKVLLWRVLIPFIDRLKAEAKREDEYTTPRIQKEFLKELEKYPELKEDIQKMLWPEKQKTGKENKKTDDDTTTTKKVPDRVINIIKDDLQNLAKRTAGAPPKS